MATRLDEFTQNMKEMKDKVKRNINFSEQDNLRDFAETLKKKNLERKFTKKVLQNKKVNTRVKSIVMDNFEIKKMSVDEVAR